MKALHWLRRQFIGPYRELRRPKLPINSELEARAQAIRLREKLGDPKPVRWTDQPDYGEQRYVSSWSFDANGTPV